MYILLAVSSLEEESPDWGGPDGDAEMEERQDAHSALEGRREESQNRDDPEEGVEMEQKQEAWIVS